MEDAEGEVEQVIDDEGEKQHPPDPHPPRRHRGGPPSRGGCVPRSRRPARPRERHNPGDVHDHRRGERARAAHNQPGARRSVAA